MAKRSGGEIVELKQEWLQDGTWDLFAVDGFEEHRRELQEYQEQATKALAFKASCDLELMAIELGIKGNTVLARRLLAVESRLAAVEAGLGRAEKEQQDHNSLTVGQVGNWIQAERVVFDSQSSLAQPCFSGKVVAIADGLLVQKIHRDGSTVAHALAKMDGSAAVGDLADVRYHHGKSEISIDRRANEKGG